jgi:arsenite methyltransferase
MNQETVTVKRPDYGLDAPEIVKRFFVIAALCAGLGILFNFAAKLGLPAGLANLSATLFSMGITFLLTACLMIWGSRVGKLRLRDKALRQINWRGDEQVLDVGCGHGLMLIGAAKRLSKGSATGIDIWQEKDQANNSAAATMVNAQAEGVANRVELLDADARNLPFAANTFDVILSSWALHNIETKSGREQAIKEIVRVLKPKGEVRILDIFHTSEYAEIFRSSGFVNVKRSAPNFIFFIPTFVLTATKPAPV